MRALALRHVVIFPISAELVQSVKPFCPHSGPSGPRVSSPTTRTGSRSSSARGSRRGWCMGRPTSSAIHATVLNRLGLDPKKLDVPGRKRLDVDHGTPITPILEG